MRGQILGGDSIPTLTVTFSRVMRVSIGADFSSAPSIEQSAMVSGRGRDRGRDFGERGRGFIGSGRGSYGFRQSASEKGPRNAGTVDAIIIFLRSVERNLIDLSGHNYLSLILLLRVTLLRNIHPLSPLFLNLPQLY